MDSDNDKLSRKCKSNMAQKKREAAALSEEVERFLKKGGKVEVVEGFKAVRIYDKFTKERRENEAWQMSQAKRV